MVKVKTPDENRAFVFYNSCTMAIQILSETVAAQIAAGEVVERPASVVKELLENAVDAGATAIAIDVREAGRQLIRVRDNGQGIPPDEVELALHRYATSKLRTIDDLSHLGTLGFRGEALHSIAAVSRLTLTSRHRHEQMGMRIVAEGGQLVDSRRIGSPVGTVVEVADLFFNVPARRKFLKSEATERRHIMDTISQYAMAYPDIRFQLTDKDREIFHSTGSGNLSDVVIQVMGLEVFREMVEVAPLPPSRPDLPPIEVYGFTTSQNIDRANRSQIHLFLNGRLITDQRLTFAVVQAYHTLLPSGRYPMSVLMIRMSPEEVDVNVHPTKAEVRFQSPDAVFAAVQRAVRAAIINYAGPATLHSPQHDPEHSVERSIDSTQLDFDLEVSPGRYSQQIDPNEDRFYPHYETPTPPHLRGTSPQVDNTDPTAIPDGLGKPRRPRSLPILRVVGQISATYIIAEGPIGMYLVDQHAAHERVLYEQFMGAYETQQIAIQHVMDTAIVELTPIMAQRLEEYGEILSAIGFEIEPFGKNLCRVKSIPAILADRDPSDVLYQVLQDIESGNAPGAQTIEDKIVKRVCKTAAIKAGQVLSHAEMQGLIRQLERCENPHTCPHGRPTLIHLSHAQLEKEFGRS